jgi:hypothetical protein
VSNSIISKISSASIDWAFESSDHASVKIDFTFEVEPLRGPGIVKVVVLQIGKENEEMMSQTDDSWNPHARLEFLKVAICLVFSLKVSEMRKVVNVEINETEEELNQIEVLKITVLSRTDINKEEMITRVETIDNAVTSLKSKLLKLRKKFSDTMTFVSKAKWFEYGKKSKYK